MLGAGSLGKESEFFHSLVIDLTFKKLDDLRSSWSNQNMLDGWIAIALANRQQ
ncbi:MAG: hypothetical protein HC845_06900 [Akkermansiaceae bacterium]|nr:hypothetical protein [Akkermansiaceae bacterium]